MPLFVSHQVEALRVTLTTHGTSSFDSLWGLEAYTKPGAIQVKQYKNPHNGEIIETKGGNHKLLKEWKAEYGSDVVEGWLAQ